MTFVYPLGLLGLIGIPILIIVYILKNKFIEQTIPSTYLWTLSERFLKRRNPLSRLSGIISLILQLLLVAVISLSVAHPVLLLEGEARNYVFVLDGSGSMTMTEDGRTRFDDGKDEILSIIDSSTEGSTYSLVLVSDTTRVVFDKLEDKEQAVTLLEGVNPSHTSVEYTEAIGKAQEYFNNDPSALVYLVTDKSYSDTRNISLINVAGDKTNVSLDNVTYTYDDKTGRVVVKGSVLSHTLDGTVTLEVLVDDSANVKASAPVSVAKGNPSDFELRFEAPYFHSLKISIKDSDSMPLDDSVVVFSSAAENAYRALIISDRPFLIESVINSVSEVETEVVSTGKYEGQTGYDLYVFDSFTPYDIPSDGAIWFINPPVSTDNTGFSVQGYYETGDALELSLSTSSSGIVKKLLKDMTGEGIYTKKYVKCGLYSTFTTLVEHKGNPIIFTGSNEYGNREVVFAFDLHESNITMLPDYVALTRNLIDFSFPTVLDRTHYTAGETLSVNVVTGCDSIVVRAPSGEVTYLSVAGTVAEHVLTECGVYEIELTAQGNAKDYYVFSSLPDGERAPTDTGDTIGLQGDASNEGIDGRYDNLLILFICLAILFSADWVVYCYEKYQLR